ncbi:MAG: GNAT family N-acetyltransferase [Erysipelotrichales bacterium]|nr:GNAT family N-acetyltransferase [Erysipelotrichales bacterium]
MSRYIETERLVIRPFKEQDLEAALEIFYNEEVKKTYMLPDFECREQAEKLFQRLMDLSLAKDRYVRGVYINDHLIGFVNDVERVEKRIEIGYAYHSRYWNQGYATEALEAVLEDLLMLGYTCVRAGHFEENLASGRVMAKCGMSKIEYTDSLEYRGKVHTCIYYEYQKEVL